MRIKILHPLTRNPLRCLPLGRERCNASRRIVVHTVERGHIDAGDACKAAQKSGTIRALTNALMIGIHQGWHDDLTFPDHKGIHNPRQRLRVERRTRSARNDERIACRALCTAQPHMAERKHFDNVEVIHLKRNSKADDSEVRKGCLRLHAHHRRLRALVAREFRTVGQKYALTRRIPTPVEKVVDDVKPEVRHSDKVGIRIGERKARASSHRIAVTAALLCKALLQTALQPMIQVPPLPLSLTPSRAAHAVFRVPR